MVLLYNLGVHLYRLGIGVASLFDAKAKAWIVGRRKWYTKLEKCDFTGNWAWVHCASLGEFEQGRPVIERMKHDYPDMKILLTFFSPSGYTVRKDYAQADHVCYLPLDTKRNARKFVTLVNPKVAVFIKYEFWFNFYSALRAESVSTFLVSAVFRSNQVFFRWYGRIFRKMLLSVSGVFVQDEASGKLASSLGVQNVFISGDTRFDRVASVAKQKQERSAVKNFVEGYTVVIAGSTWPEDERLLSEYISSSDPRLRFIIAPHEIGEQHLTMIERNLGVTSIRLSRLRANDEGDERVLLVDNVGQLNSLYGYADVAYVGGGFGKGIHNILEPAAHGMPVLFGPNHLKFNEATQLIEAGGAFTVNNCEDIRSRISFLIEGSRALERASDASCNYVMTNKGATDKVMSHLREHLP